MSLPLKTPVISSWLKQATSDLRSIGISSARLDAELILAHTLRKPRTYLHAHTDDPLEPRAREIADARLVLRLDHIPVAYIIGHKEFYGRQFKVTPSTLIPRPETEAMITLVKSLLSHLPDNLLVDVGTGSGCIGITIKLEIPELDVTLIDTSRHALVVAESNAKLHKATVALIQGDLLLEYPFTADCIVANLPYVDTAWARSPETDHEPPLALFASDNGLHLIKRLITQTETALKPGGLLLLEADPKQHEAIMDMCTQHKLVHLKTEGFILAFQKAH